MLNNNVNEENINVDKYVEELEQLSEEEIVKILIDNEPEYKLYYQIDRKLQKFDKILVMIIDYNQKNKYNVKLLKQSQKTLINVFKLNQKAIIIFDLNKLPVEMIIGIKETPAFYIFKKENAEIIFSAQGYILKQN